MNSNFCQLKKTLPTLGVGLGLRAEVAQQTLERTDRIDWLEIISEQYMNAGGASRELLEHAAGVYPIIPHGVNLSIGSTDSINESYKQSLKALVDKLNPPWWSDHLCFTSHGGVYMNELLPLPFTKETAKYVAERGRMMQDFMERPFLFENITFYMRMPGSTMTEAQFLSEVLELSDCGLLLDINNVHVNALNHGFDPFEFLKQIPLERTVQLHMAGHIHAPELNAYVDTHGAPIVEPVFELLKYVVDNTEVKAILLERDQNFPDDFNDILMELDEIRSIAGSRMQSPLKSSAEVRREQPYSIAVSQITASSASAAQRTGSAPPASLARVERAMQILWMDPDQSERFATGDKTQIEADIAAEVDATRLPVYVNVIHSSYLNSMTKAYPACAKLLKPTWKNIVADYIALNQPRSYDMLLLGEQFPQFVEEYLFDRYKRAFPFLLELAKYERIETQSIHHKGIIETESQCSLDTPENYIKFGPILNPTLTIREYEFPVHQIDEKLRHSNRIPRNIKKAKTYLLTYQSPNDRSVIDFEVDSTTTALLEKIASSNISYAELAQLVLGYFAKEDQHRALKYFAEFIEDMHTNGVFTGDRNVEKEAPATKKVKVIAK